MPEINPAQAVAMGNRRSRRGGASLSNRLLLIRRGFGCLALGFAQCGLLLLFSLFFLGACACCSLSLGPVSTVIRLECHGLPPCVAGWFCAPPLYIRPRFIFCRPCPLLAPPRYVPVHLVF